ncbi:MAG: hypothetical protein ACFFE4_06550 [Candidatus Thorarchaeota archaeon]
MSQNLALMFNVKPGGEVEAINWSKDSFMSDTSVIVLDESSESLFLWHGVQQGLVARRTALRQAESLKGHGYTVGKSIIGRDIKVIKEIDARKVGKVPEDTELNNELQAVLEKSFTQLDNFIVTFQSGVVAPKPITQKVKEEPKVEVKTTPVQPTPTPVTPVKAPIASKPKDVGSEYDDVEVLPPMKPTTTSQPAPAIHVSKTSLNTDAKIAFVFSAIIEHFDDIWISKKSDGSFSVEEMDGPICAFNVNKGGQINFTANSFNRIDPKIKTAIQKKFIELSKLI